MAEVQQRLLILAARWHWAVLVALALPLVATGQKFYDDDPLEREPVPLRVDKARPRKLSDYYDLFLHQFTNPGVKQTRQRQIPAGDVNTRGEVLDGAWYQNRHGKRRMTIRELIAGPGDSNAPADGPWSVISAKNEGVTPGFMIRDARGRRYFLKFDPIGYPEIATSADVISSKLFYALGYHVPENYIVYFNRSRLQLKKGASFRDNRGRKRELTPKDLSEILMKARSDSDGRYRASVSLLIEGEILKEFRYFGTRSDDPNDTVPHEHRRMLRGLQVFCAWLNHEDSRAINTLDTLVQEGASKYIKHYLIDFGSTLGSASNGPNSPRSGFEQFFTWRSAAKEFLSFGAYVPDWARIHYPDMPSVGRFSAQFFDPARWTPEYPNPAFDNRLPEDTFWAASQVMAFTDEDIRAVVKTGQYSDPKAERYVADTIIARRDAIGRAYLSEPLSLAGIRVEGGQLTFEDLAVKHHYLEREPDYRIEWFSLDNETGRRTSISGAKGATIPGQGTSEYLAAGITAGNTNRRVMVYLRRDSQGSKIVGVERQF